MSDFAKAIPVILKHEGGWVNDPADRGKETNFGISTLILERIQADGKLSNDAMEKMLGIKAGTLFTPNYLKVENGFTKDSASKIYKLIFWDKTGYEKINDQNLATKVLDISVNCGQGNAGELLQQAVNSLDPEGTQVAVDGRPGPITFAAVNAADPKKLILALREQQIEYYNKVSKRGQNIKFLPGWLKRAAWIDPTCW